MLSCDRDAARDDESEPAQGVSQAATIAANFVEKVLATELNSPTAMALAPDGRIFVCLQGGALRVIKNDALLSTPFLTVSTDSSGERGLLGVAFDPNFASNQFVYVYYTATSPTVHNRVARYRASGDVAVAGSATTILDLENLSSATNHNGGAIHFGPDGKLYIATGENANSANAQSMSSRLGKILRINADGSIPSDNPFYNTATGVYRAIWAYGLRNPFTFAFQPGSGRMFVNDVGQDMYEEINDGIAGSNYGWPLSEGPTTDSRFRAPLFSYTQGSGPTNGCSIAGGAFYNPANVQFPSSYVGKYFFADYCTSWIRVFDPATRTATGFATNLGQPVDLAVGADGALYYLARSYASVGRISYNGGGQAPSITAQPQSRTVGAGQAVTFNVGATGTQPLSYRWQRGTTNIAGATGASYTFNAAASDNGATFRAIVSNSIGSATSSSATLTVSSNRAPSAAISAPAAGSSYAAGDTISFVGTATDPEDGSLAASQFSWEVVFHHDAHVHPFIAATPGVKTGSFVVPRTGHTETNVFYRINLTVRDSAGLTTSVSRDIVPRLASLNLQTSPAGLQVTLDGTPITTPSTITSVVGVTRALGVLTPQSSGGRNYQFTSWSDGGSATHNVNTPASNTTFTATFSETAATGGGLKGEYYDNVDLTALKLTRTDATVNFDWASGSPAASIGIDTFSVRWSGTVTPQYSQAFTFYTSSDDGVRLWLNNVLLIDNWTDHGLTEDRATSTVLNAGQAYPIRLEFYESGGAAVSKLSWSSASQTKQIIPASRLAPAVVSPPPPPPPSAGADLTRVGTIIAKVTAPEGGGNHDIAIIRDGIKPAVGSDASWTQYDTFRTSVASSDDWIGYQFAQTFSFGRVVFQEGIQFGDGGWFDTLTVQVRQAGSWVTVSNLVSSPAYPRNNGASFETFNLTFTPISGDAIRIYGAPGGSADFISVAELEVFAP
jgi:glucose/arabinose dehydrogenase